MIRSACIHRSHDAYVVDAFTDMRIKLADFDAALSHLLERKRRWHKVAARPRLPGLLHQFRLGIKRVDMRRTAIHEQEDYMLRFGRKV